MSYKDVFQLAESKGYKISLVEHLITPELTKISEKTYQDLLYVSLCMVQKWLRDTHKIEVLVSNFTGTYKPYYGEIPYLINESFHDTYESALSEGINAALQLI